MLKYIFKALNILVGFICMASLCAVDSPSWMPTIAFVLSGAYLGFLAYRNGWMYGGEGADE